MTTMDSEMPDTGLEQPIEPGLLVEPQAGAVVSRTLLKQPSGNVTVFAFDGGEGRKILTGWPVFRPSSCLP